MTFYFRDQWNARPPTRPLVERSYDKITGAVLHWSAVPPANTRDEDSRQVLGIQQFHQQTRGWADIAYHRLISNRGDVYEGRPLPYIGGHTAGKNTPLIGYCFLTDRDPTPEAFAAYMTQAGEDMQTIGKAYGTIEPHSHYSATACPGDTVRAWMAGPVPAPGPEAPPAPSYPPPVAPYVPPWPGRLITQPPVMSGTDVFTWQTQMVARGWRLNPDGAYGPASERACRAFQGEKGLGVDGIVGPDTWNATWSAPVT